MAVVAEAGTATPSADRRPGRFDRHVITAVKAAGYRAATTTRPGIARPSDPRYELPRIRVDPGAGPAELLHALGTPAAG